MPLRFPATAPGRWAGRRRSIGSAGGVGDGRAALCRRAGGNAYPILPVANAPTGSTLDLAMYAPTGGLPISGGTARAATAPASPATQSGAAVTDTAR